MVLWKRSQMPFVCGCRALAIRQLQEKIGLLQAEQQESARHLQRLSDIHANLEPLLSRLSALLHAK